MIPVSQRSGSSSTSSSPFVQLAASTRTTGGQASAPVQPIVNRQSSIVNRQSNRFPSPTSTSLICRYKPNSVVTHTQSGHTTGAQPPVHRPRSVARRVLHTRQVHLASLNISSVTLDKTAPTPALQQQIAKWKPSWTTRWIQSSRTNLPLRSSIPNPLVHLLPLPHPQLPIPVDKRYRPSRRSRILGRPRRLVFRNQVLINGVNQIELLILSLRRPLRWTILLMLSLRVMLAAHRVLLIQSMIALPPKPKTDTQAVWI